MKHHTVYCLRDPRNEEIRYVGCTRLNLKERLWAHIAASNQGTGGVLKGRWIQELLLLGLRPTMDVLEIVYQGSWQEAERRWIKQFRDAGVSLTNASDGGLGLPGHVKSPETIRKHSEAFRNTPRTPQWNANIRAAKLQQTEETRRKISLALQGVPLSTEHRKALSDSHKGKTLPTSQKRAISAANRGRTLPASTRANQSRSKLLRKPSRPGMHVGVHQTPHGRWISRAYIDKRDQYLGTFATSEEAARVRDKAVIMAYGIGNVYLNFPPK